MTVRWRFGCALTLAVLVAACGDGEAALPTTTTVAATTTTADAVSVFEKARCDPAAAILNSDDYGLVLVSTNLDTGHGPDPTATCVFELLRPQEVDEDIPPSRIFDVSESGVATERSVH